MKLQDLRMLDRYEQVRLYTPAEFERRWQVARSVMQTHGCRTLVVFSPSFEGYDQWLADVRGLNLVIVPESGAVPGAAARGFCAVCRAANAYGNSNYCRSGADIARASRRARGGCEPGCDDGFPARSAWKRRTCGCDARNVCRTRGKKRRGNYGDSQREPHP